MYWRDKRLRMETPGAGRVYCKESVTTDVIVGGRGGGKQTESLVSYGIGPDTFLYALLSLPSLSQSLPFSSLCSSFLRTFCCCCCRYAQYILQRFFVSDRYLPAGPVERSCTMNNEPRWCRTSPCDVISMNRAAEQY